MTHTDTRPALIREAAAQFGDARGYLAAASIGLPTRASVAAITADLDAWFRADRDPQGYDAIIERTRVNYARLVSVPVDRVATGSQTSVIVSLIAAAAPSGAEILVIDGDFTSIAQPFLERGDLLVRFVPLEAYADSISETTWLAAFALVQSATGEVADVSAIIAAAAATDTYTLCDTTQATGVLPVDASLYDVTVCHSYKWLCSPRGVAFLTVSERFDPLMTPLQAGWYAGEDVWQSCYAPGVQLAANARRFDVSPAWQAWVGADPAIGMFADLDIGEVWRHTSGLGDALCTTLGIAEQHRAIVSWRDPDAVDLRTLIDAGIRVSGRAGRLRASFHLWNTIDDVDAVVHALDLSRER